MAAQELYASVRKGTKYYVSQSTDKPWPVRDVRYDDDVPTVYGGPGGNYRLGDVDFYLLLSGRFVRLYAPKSQGTLY